MQESRKPMVSGAGLLIIGLALLGGGCSSMKMSDVWPLGESKVAERPRGPENATEYRCDGGKSFHVRYLEGRAAVWLIYPDRQVRLDKAAGTATRYSNGIANLLLDGAQASLNDGPSIAYTGCKS